jgi:prepilin-type N-terminal cleavage/methylation domain-containing protein
MRRIRYHQQGFTLMEMMLVIIIALLLATIGYPAYTDMMARHRLNAATVQVMSDLMSSRKRALSQQHSVQILFNRNEQQNYGNEFQNYRIWNDFDNSNSSKNVDDRNEITDKSTLAFGVHMRSNNNPRFYPSGSVTNLPTIKLRHPMLSRRKARCITISITGRIKQQSCTY